MKKFFCFHCQQDVEPYKILKWRICPNCRKLITDDGNGFYRVCDACGANMPSDGEYCLKCGHNLHGGPDKNPEMERFLSLYKRRFWANGLLGICLVVLIFFMILGILYVSFYFVLFGVVFAVAAAILNYIRQLMTK